MPKKLLGAAAEFVEKELGGPTTETEDVVSVGVSVTAVLGNDPERVSVVLVNLSANVIFIGFDEAVGAARGIRLAAGGGSASWNVREDYTLPLRAVFALATGANSNLYVLSLRRFTKVAEDGDQ